jgi:hypothetical protein
MSSSMDRSQIHQSNVWRKKLAVVLFVAVSPAGPALGSDNCDCGACSGCRSHGPVYTALDTIAAGIEHLVNFKVCIGKRNPGRSWNTTSGCDGECDAMVMDPMTMGDEHRVYVPAAPNSRSQFSPNTPGVGSPPSILQPHSPSAPMLRPSAPVRMSPPQIRSIPQPTPELSNQMHVPVPMRDSVPDQTAPTGSGVAPNRDQSIFDSTTDPFRDDSAELNRPRVNGIRRTSYHAPDLHSDSPQ